MKKHRLKKSIIGVLFSLMMVCASAQAAEAAQEGIQISPLTFKYEIKPGESQSGQITIKNLNPEPLDYTLESEVFASVSDDGAPSFTTKTQENGVSTLADWISVPQDKTGNILASGNKIIDFTISVPTGAEPGGHYAAIFAKQLKKTTGGQTEIGIASRVGALILVTVPGEMRKGAELTEFTAPSFVSGGPVKLTMKVKNTGTIHFDSTGSAEIKSLFGKTVAVDLGTHTIIPNNARNFEGTWNSKYPFGRYAITATATDADGKPMTTTAVLWALPLIIVIPVLIGIILVTFIYFYIKKHFKIVTVPDQVAKK